MKALIVKEHGPLENLLLEEVPAPAPGPGEVLVDVHAASVNFPDLLVIGGTYQKLPPRPFSPGKDFAGVVSAVGQGATMCKVGDHVGGQVEYGAYAAKCIVPAVNCQVMPQAMCFAEGAATGLRYLTAHFALVERASLKPREYALMNGAAGGIGVATVQLAKALGAKVIASAGSKSKAALARANGAAWAVRTDVPDLRESFRTRCSTPRGAMAPIWWWIRSAATSSTRAYARSHGAGAS